MTESSDTKFVGRIDSAMREGRGLYSYLTAIGFQLLAIDTFSIFIASLIVEENDEEAAEIIRREDLSFPPTCFYSYRIIQKSPVMLN